MSSFINSGKVVVIYFDEWLYIFEVTNACIYVKDRYKISFLNLSEFKRTNKLLSPMEPFSTDENHFCWGIDGINNSLKF